MNLGVVYNESQRPKSDDRFIVFSYLALLDESLAFAIQLIYNAGHSPVNKVKTVIDRPEERSGGMNKNKKGRKPNFGMLSSWP